MASVNGPVDGMDEVLISADSHVLEPPNLWKERLPAELRDQARALADRSAHAPTGAVGLIKRDLNRALSVDLETALDYEAYQQEIAGRSADFREGVMSFVEKRSAQFDFESRLEQSES